MLMAEDQPDIIGMAEVNPKGLLYKIEDIEIRGYINTFIDGSREPKGLLPLPKKADCCTMYYGYRPMRGHGGKLDV